jgi:hypothetical protein
MFIDFISAFFLAEIAALVTAMAVFYVVDVFEEFNL